MGDSDSPGDGRGGRTVLELPVTVTAQKRGKQRSPQENIDEFWKKFTTRAPGRGETASLPFPYLQLARCRSSGSSPK